MYFLNVIDEQNRFVKLKAYNEERIGQDDSHTMSYLACRKQLQELGRVMGLEKCCENGN